MRDVAISEKITIPAAEIKMAFARSGGPGGQNVNKVETKVELRWSPADSTAFNEADRTWLVSRLQSRLTGSGELLVTSTKTRDQQKNREDALDKLADIIRSALKRPKLRKPTKPSRGAKRRRFEDKKHRGAVKRDRQAPDS